MASSLSVAPASSGGDREMDGVVLAALETLYQSHTQPEQQKAADAYLRGFQLTPDAFAVCVRLLDRFLPQCAASPSGGALPIAFFASQTLANKLRRQHAFPAATSGEQWASQPVAWAGKMVAWLSLPAVKIPKMVSTQLTLALVASMPRIAPAEVAAARKADGDGQNMPVTPIANIIHARSASAPESVVGLVLDRLAAANVQIAVLAELLVVLAEEVSDIRERAARDRMQTEIDAWAATVLDQLLPQIMHEAIKQAEGGAFAQDATSTQDIVLRAVKSWLRYASVSPQAVVSNPLLQSLLVFLSRDELFDVSVDLTVDIVRCYSDVHHDQVVTQWIVPQIMQLQDAFRAAAEMEDTDKCLGLCRIFTEMAESYILLLLGEQNIGQAAVVEMLLDCMDYPEAEVADVTIPFWFSFLGELLRVDSRHRDALVAKYSSNVMRLAGICMHKLRFDEDFPKLPMDKQQDFKGFRQELGDILRDCCQLLGVDAILNHCVHGLEQICQHPQEQRPWEAVEAHLYCFRSIARQIETSKGMSVDASVQVVFQYLPQFSSHPAICYTSCLIISRYGEWLKANSSSLSQQVEFLNQCVMNSARDPLYTEWEVPRAAATAIRSLAIDCWTMLGPNITDFYLHIEHHELMPVEDQVLILEGVCSGVSKSRDMDALLAVLNRVMEPIGRRLQALFSSPSPSASVAMNEMLRLICIYEYMDVDMKRFRGGSSSEHPLVVLTQQVWPMFNQMLALFRSNDELVERVCRCYKRILRTCGHSFQPLLPQLVDNLLSFYQADPKSSYLYAGSMVIKYYSSESSESNALELLFAKMLASFANTTFPIFNNTMTMQCHPDVVEEFFYLMERGVKCVPNVLLAPPQSDSSAMPLLVSALQASVASLAMTHNDANKAALCFLETCLREGMRQPHHQQLSAADSNESFASVLQQCLFTTPAVGGKQLVDRLLRGVVLGTMSPSRVDADFGSIASVLVQLATANGGFLRECIAEWFAHATAGSFSTALVNFVTPTEAQDFQRDLFGTPDERSFRRCVRHFGKLCASRNSSLKDADRE